MAGLGSLSRSQQDCQKGSKETEKATDAGEFSNLAYKDPEKANSVLATALRNARQYMTTPTDAAKALEHGNFTKLLAGKMKSEMPVEPQPFEVHPKVKHAIAAALSRMKPNRASGLDGIFAEGLQIARKEATDLLCEVWEACGRLNYTPSQLRAAEIIPLYKKGDTSRPENYRPIALLSHVRKVIDKAVDLLVRAEYNFHNFQVGFRALMGTETAIVRAQEAIDDGYLFLACLDLKAAYDSVPRSHLMRRLRRVLSKNTCDMVSHILQPTSFVTRGDNQKNQGSLQVGVQQGSPASPALFNIYIDELALDLDRLAYFDTSRAAIFYADDVLLLAKSPWELQRLLDIASRWARCNGMTWSTEKSSALAPEHCTYSFKLAGDALQQVSELDYLGVSLALSGVTDTRSLGRIQAAQAKFSAIAELEKRIGKLPATTAVSLFKSVILPVAEYGIHLSRTTDKLVRAYELLEARILAKVMGQVAPLDIPRARKLLRLPSYAERKCILIGKMCARAETMKAHKSRNIHPIVAKLRKDNADIVLNWYARRHRPPRATKETVRSNWSALCARHVRRIPNPHTGAVPALTLRNRKVRVRACWYYFTRFPCGSDSRTKARLQAHGEDPHHLDVVRQHLAEVKLSKTQSQELESAILAIIRSTSPPNR